MRAFVAVMVLVAVTPGVAEVIETAAHVIAHADLPHHGDDGHPAEDEEHSCTPLAHHCGCHTSMSAQTASRAALRARPYEATARPGSIVIELGRVGEPPPLRPPIA